MSGENRSTEFLQISIAGATLACVAASLDHAAEQIRLAELVDASVDDEVEAAQEHIWTALDLLEARVADWMAIAQEHDES